MVMSWWLIVLHNASNGYESQIACWVTRFTSIQTQTEKNLCRLSIISQHECSLISAAYSIKTSPLLLISCGSNYVLSQEWLLKPRCSHSNYKTHAVSGANPPFLTSHIDTTVWEQIIQEAPCSILFRSECSNGRIRRGGWWTKDDWRGRQL